jgi:hypothetical protein
MQDEKRCESVARMVAMDCMMALNLDYANDFRTRDKIIVAISDRIDRTLNEIAERAFSDLDARSIIQQLASAPAELDDERLSYMTIQVDRDLIERAKKWLEGGSK